MKQTKSIFKILIVLFLIIIIMFFSVGEVYSAIQSRAKNGNYTKSKANDIDSQMEDADNFTNVTTAIDESKLQKVSNSLYNLLLGIGIICAIVIGVSLGIKYMVTSVEEKADIKEGLKTYVLGCIVVFGAFGIWKLVIAILSNI